MPPPANTTSGTATEVLLSAFPYVTTQAVSDAGTVYTVWYKLVNNLGRDAVITVWFYGVIPGSTGVYYPDYQVLVDPGLVTEVVMLDAFQNCPAQLPIADGATYYVRVQNTGSTTSATLNINLTVKPSGLAIPAGQVLIVPASANQAFVDAGGMYASVINPTTDAIVNFLPFFVAAEWGDVLDTGIYCFPDAYRVGTPPATSFQAWDLVLYDQDLQPLTRTNFPAPASGTTFQPLVRANQFQEHFWIVVPKGSAASTRYASLTTSGTLSTVQNLDAHPLSSFSRVSAHATTNTESHLLVMYDSYTYSEVKQWNLSTLTWDSDLVAAYAGHYGTDIVVLPDQSLIVSYRQQTNPAGSTKVRHYSAAGALVTAYSITHPDVTSTPPRLGSSADSAYFWLWISQNNGESLLRKMAVSDGTIASESLIYNVLQSQQETASPALIYTSDSCPAIETRRSDGGGGYDPLEHPPYVTPSYDLNARYIRRLRRAPHVANENVRIFYRKFELDLERGVGLASGQGSDPEVMIRLSRDGGHTWGEPQVMSAGAMGAYTQRVIARRLGQARDTVFEVTVSDPVAWSLVNAWLDLEAGTS